MRPPQRIRVGEIEMSWVEAGKGARPLVLVHGYTGAGYDFHRVLDDLAGAGRTLAVDQRGHGDSSNPGHGYDFETLVADLRGFLDALGVERCDLLGHSLGGMVVLRFALAHPERLHSLVLMDTAPGPVGLLPAPVLEGVASLARTQGMQAVAALQRQTYQPDRVAPAMRRWIDADPDTYFEAIEMKMGKMDPEAMAELGALLGDHPGIEDDLERIACPTTVLVGAQDPPFRTPSEGLAQAIPEAELVVIEDACHSPQAENREAWLAAMRTHLARVR